MNFHLSPARLDAYRHHDSPAVSRAYCRLHLFFCSKCRMALASLKESDKFVDQIKKAALRDKK
ncbi:MAG: hypothetical protein E7053_09335 [Lentisphaerae bacterium]|nr:hypothetical protein [Lentisphaerota bacterium]